MKRLSAAVVASSEGEASLVPARRKIMARYPIATIGSHTVQGGRVVVDDQERASDGFRIACVGVSGAGNASTFGDRPVALVGSHVENGDRIAQSPQNMGEIFLFEGDAPITGLLQPGYRPARGNSEA